MSTSAARTPSTSGNRVCVHIPYFVTALLLILASSPYRTNAESLLNRLAEKANSCCLSFDREPFEVARGDLQKATKTHNFTHLVTISDTLIPPGICRNVLFLDAASNLMPSTVPGSVVAFISHRGPLTRTGWPLRVHVMGKAFGGTKFVYMGEYQFRLVAEEAQRLQKGDWNELPEKVCYDLSLSVGSLSEANQIQKHVARRAAYARDSRAKIICAKTYLQEKGERPTGPRLSAAVHADKDRNARLKMMGETARIAAVRSALSEGEEVSALSSTSRAARHWVTHTELPLWLQYGLSRL